MGNCSTAKTEQLAVQVCNPAAKSFKKNTHTHMIRSYHQLDEEKGTPKANRESLSLAPPISPIAFVSSLFSEGEHETHPKVDEATSDHLNQLERRDDHRDRARDAEPGK